jgi:hypothetical protein
MGEEGDTVVLIINGIVDGEHLEVTHPRSVAAARQYGYAMTLIDARKATAMSASARRTAAALNRSDPILSASAIFGANLLTRTLATLLWRAVALLTAQKSDLAFFETEAEARAWLAQQRPKLRALAAPRP